MTLGDLELAEATFRKGLDYPSMFMRVERPRYLAGLATIALARGRLDEALALADEARAFVEQKGMAHLRPLVELVAGRVHLARGEHEQALAALARAEELGSPMAMRALVAQARLEAAALLEAAGQAEEAQAKRQAAQALIAEIAALFQDETLRQAYLEAHT